ncbi:MAG: hypothetical protein DRI89_09220 [Bacteroidetes bacterium]|nr:MAG: hypothetical protein DRI89_09220 [Bacteroidota bacterium]
MKILHPFMPFITEEIWHLLYDRQENDDIIVAAMPVSNGFDDKMITAFDRAEKIIIAIRNVRKDKNIPQKESINMLVKAGDFSDCIFNPVVAKMGNIESIEIVDEKPENVLTFTVGAQEYFIPISDSIDVEAEIAKLEEELKYTRGFLSSVTKKLSNERFVNNAPAAVVDKEKKKAADAEARINVIEEQLKGLR